MATWNDLAAFVNATSGADDTFVQSCWDAAKVMVDDFVGTNIIPTAALDRAYLACGSELFHARQAPNGIAAGFEGAPVRISRNAMNAAYPFLQNYMVMGL